ncbi:hypothetical protein MMC14_001986 [Varicellaria rhodocarpa]|nr:hypothetical protein [Varicellaria rhodocarpa]
MKSTIVLASLAVLFTSTLAQDLPCTTTVVLPAPPFNISPTTTTYLQTVTSTSSVDCGSCDAVTTSTEFFGHGPAKPSPTETVIVESTVSTTYVCEATYPAKKA